MHSMQSKKWPFRPYLLWWLPINTKVLTVTVLSQSQPSTHHNILQSQGCLRGYHWIVTKTAELSLKPLCTLWHCSTQERDTWSAWIWIRAVLNFKWGHSSLHYLQHWAKIFQSDQKTFFSWRNCPKSPSKCSWGIQTKIHWHSIQASSSHQCKQEGFGLCKKLYP